MLTKNKYYFSLILHIILLSLLTSCSSFFSPKFDKADGATYNRRQMALAMINGDLSRVKLLIPDIIDVNDVDQDGITPIRLAVLSGRVDILEYLISKGADINATGEFGSALDAAAFEGNFEIVEFLLEKGADVNTTDTDGYTPLHSAANLDIVKLLLKKDANVNAKNTNGATPLHSAAERGRLELVKLLLKKDADVNAKTKNGDTALSIAAKAGHTAIVKLLQEQGTK